MQLDEARIPDQRMFNMREKAEYRLFGKALSISFFMWILSAGNPDILDQVVKILETFT